MLHLFKFNFTEMPALTMEKAVEMCRERAILENKGTSLFVMTAKGNWLHLADYDPINPKAYALYRTNPKDLKSPIGPQVNVTLY